jgi:hypothetical protein
VGKHTLHTAGTTSDPIISLQRRKRRFISICPKPTCSPVPVLFLLKELPLGPLPYCQLAAPSSEWMLFKDYRFFLFPHFILSQNGNNDVLKLVACEGS